MSKESSFSEIIFSKDEEYEKLMDNDNEGVHTDVDDDDCLYIIMDNYEDDISSSDKEEGEVKEDGQDNEEVDMDKFLSLFSNVLLLHRNIIL